MEPLGSDSSSVMGAGPSSGVGVWGDSGVAVGDSKLGLCNRLKRLQVLCFSLPQNLSWSGGLRDQWQK